MNPQLIFRTAALAIGCFFFSGASKDYATLEINIKDCRSDRLEWLSELSVIKDNKIIKVLQPQHDSRQSLSALDTGTYFLEYKSIFGQAERSMVKITQFRKYSIELCVDYLNHSRETYKPVIDLLQDKEYYEIQMSSQGCFHSTADNLIISRKNSTYSLSWKNSVSWFVKKKTLTPSDIDAIRHFEIELNHMDDRGCTTLDTYVVIYKNSTKEVMDGSCNWNGGDYLREKLFGKR